MSALQYRSIVQHDKEIESYLKKLGIVELRERRAKYKEYQRAQKRRMIQFLTNIIDSEERPVLQTSVGPIFPMKFSIFQGIRSLHRPNQMDKISQIIDMKEELSQIQDEVIPGLEELKKLKDLFPRNDFEHKEKKEKEVEMEPEIDDEEEDEEDNEENNEEDNEENESDKENEDDE